MGSQYCWSVRHLLCSEFKLFQVLFAITTTQLFHYLVDAEAENIDYDDGFLSRTEATSGDSEVGSATTLIIKFEQRHNNW
jgi:hypothetical protein